MAQKGPKPKPTQLRILEGNPSRRPLPKNAPQPAVGLPQPPKDLSATGKQIWRSLAKQLTSCKIATKLDAAAFELLVRAMTDHHDASAEVARSGAVWMDGDGAIPKFAYSPYWVIQQRSFKAVVSLLREFGMTPSARTGVQMVPLTTHADDPSARYFGG